MGAKDLIEAVGTIGLILIIFAESGLLLGLIFPGDSLLIIAGTLASHGELNIWTVVIGTFVAAVAGSQVGYWIGQKWGPALFRRPDSRIFKHEYVEKSRVFFEKHGPRTIVLARFVPFVRTLAPMLAGVGEMPQRTFLIFNVTGALMWAVGMSLIGYFIGESFEGADKYVIGAVLVLSITPVAIEVLKRRRASRGAPVEVAQAEVKELREILHED